MDKLSTTEVEIHHQILKDIRACRICTDLPLGPKPIIWGNVSAKILLIGQAPGIKVHESGIPWNDASGNNLRQWMGINRDDFYNQDNIAVGAMGFCYPGTGVSGDLPPRKICAQTWRPSVHQAFPNVKLIMLIGSYSIDYYLKGVKAKSMTETILQFEKHLPQYFVLPHPSPRNNGWFKNNPWFKEELIHKLQEKVWEALS